MKKNQVAIPCGEDRYSQLMLALEAADIGIWDWDLETNRVVMSDNMRRILPMDNPGAVIPFESFLQVVHPDERVRIEGALQRAIRRRSAFDEEFRAERSDPETQWLRIRGRVSVRPDGSADRVMGSIHDKTERKMAYDAVAQARNELEGKVKERTRELLDANERLRREISLKNDLQKQIMEISEKEQRRIGQDLHDSLSQQIGGISFMAQVILEKLKTAHPEEAPSMKKLITHLQNALTYTRDLARGLYPTLGEGGLSATLTELAVSVTELYGVPVTFQGDKDLDSRDEEVTIHAYRIVQEALNNAIRHGQASRIDIRLFRREQAVVLAVSDNGVGFPEKPNRKGIGLNIMEYRASSIGATFEIRSERDQGTEIRCVFSTPRRFNSGETEPS
jgi:signal transduction histidine kinase